MGVGIGGSDKDMTTREYTSQKDSVQHEGREHQSDGGFDPRADDVRGFWGPSWESAKCVAPGVLDVALATPRVG